MQIFARIVGKPRLGIKINNEKCDGVSSKMTLQTGILGKNFRTDNNHILNFNRHCESKYKLKLISRSMI